MKNDDFKDLQSMNIKFKKSYIVKDLLFISCILLFSITSHAQQFIPAEWQIDSQLYSQNDSLWWVRDKDGNRIDDIIDDKGYSIVDIVVDLNRFVHRDTLLNNYRQFVGSNETDSIYIDNYVSFLFVPGVSVADINEKIIKREEVFMVEYAGAFMGDLDITIPSMGIRSGFYSPIVEDNFFNNMGDTLTGAGIGIMMLDCGVNDHVPHQAMSFIPGYPVT